MDLFKPTECFRKYYTIEKYEPKCSCIFKCKYPSPKELALENIKKYNAETFFNFLKKDNQKEMMIIFSLNQQGVSPTGFEPVT